MRKVDPDVSELPRGNELSRDHMNRPSVSQNIDNSGTVVKELPDNLPSLSA